jgi:hypothetical protein
MPDQSLLESSVRDPLPMLKEQLKEEFADFPRERIDQVAEEVFHEFDAARIREFVPVFAWRRARRVVRSEAA